jgi:hypothetical protein
VISEERRTSGKPKTHTGLREIRAAQHYPRMKSLLFFFILAGFVGIPAQDLLHRPLPLWVIPCVLFLAAILLPLVDANQKANDRAARRERSMHPVPWEKR